MRPRQSRYARKQLYETRPKPKSVRRLVKFGLLIFMALLLTKLSLMHSTGHADAAIKALPLQSVCLDPGHGGNDPGAQNGNLTEASVNLAVAKKVSSALLAKGYGVYMTRTTDKTLDNADRVNFCNAKRTTILVSIHQNSYTDSGPDYSTALQYKPEDEELANTLANAAGAELALPITPPMQFEDGMLMRAKMPSIIIESLFISNDAEANAGDRVSQQAQGIINGISEYLQAHKPAQPVKPPKS